MILTKLGNDFRRGGSRDEGHPTCDEEDSSATSISDDAMIDDEIADQPGLVMLGQVIIKTFFE